MRRPGRWGRMIWGKVAPFVVAVVVASTGSGCVNDRPPMPSPTVESPAVDPAKVRSDLAARIERHLTTNKRYELVRSVVVLVDGETVFERYYKTSAAKTHDIESVTKTVMSILVGIALAEGKLRSLDQTLAELLPDYAARMKPAVAAATLRQVLNATGGFSGEAEDDYYDFAATKDWTEGVLASGVRPPGQAFGYSNGGAHLLSAILVEATDQSVLQYARAELFDPLGIDTRPVVEVIPVGRGRQQWDRAEFAWPIDPQGRHLGASLMKLTPTDLAKLGVLALDEGRWQGRQVVPEQWIREATTNQLGALGTNRGVTDGYGYLWWTKTVGDDPAYLAWGAGGQLIEVIPARGLVIVTACEVDPFAVTSPSLDADQLQYLADSVIAPLFKR